MPRTATSYNLSLDLGETGRTSRSVTNALINAIAQGQLKDGDKMPSSRTIARELGLSRSTVVGAYEELAASGFLVSRPGGGTWVEHGSRRASLAGVFHPSPSDVAPPLSPPVSGLATPKFNLLPGFPDTTLIMRREWNSAWKKATRETLTAPASVDIDGNFDGRHRQYFPQLCRLLADHVRISRAIVCDPRDIFIFPGVNNLLQTLGPLLINNKGTFAFENPGYTNGRRALSGAGANIRAVPVDNDGLCTELLRSSDKAVYTTPAHQFPLGSRLSPGRRTQLLDWAVANNALVFEDDYDGEFRYDVSPMPALRSMKGGEECVVYIGTASKILARDLRLAWAIVPAHLSNLVRERLFEYGDSTNPIAAAAMACLLDSGAVVRQIVALQRIYAARRVRFTDACSLLLPEMEQRGIHAGLHLVLTKDDPFDDHTVAAELMRQGLACAVLSSCYASQEGSTSGLVCGYSRLPETQAEAAVTTIRRVLDSLGE